MRPEAQARRWLGKARWAALQALLAQALEAQVIHAYGVSVKRSETGIGYGRRKHRWVLLTLTSGVVRTRVAFRLDHTFSRKVMESVSWAPSPCCGALTRPDGLVIPIYFCDLCEITYEDPRTLAPASLLPLFEESGDPLKAHLLTADLLELHGELRSSPSGGQRGKSTGVDENRELAGTKL